MQQDFFVFPRAGSRGGSADPDLANAGTGGAAGDAAADCTPSSGPHAGALACLAVSPAAELARSVVRCVKSSGCCAGGETQPERLEITKGIIEKFSAETGVGVSLVATDEDQLPELMITNAASGTLPDVVFHPIDFTIGWAARKTYASSPTLILLPSKPKNLERSRVSGSRFMVSHAQSRSFLPSLSGSGLGKWTLAPLQG